MRWLQRALDGATGTCRLAFWHRPRFSAGSVHGDSPDTAPLWNALRGHARLILGGHDHLMLRFRRHDGMTQYVAGSGGDTLYGAVRDDRVAFSRAGTQGALRMRLRAGARGSSSAPSTARCWTAARPPASPASAPTP